MSENHSCQVGSCLVAFAAGALAGAGIALFYAPHSGKETRHLLAERTRHAKDKVGDALHAAKDKVGGALHAAGDVIHEKKAEISAAVTAGRKAMREQGTASSDSA